MVVEDDPQVRQVLRRQLQRHGYDVSEAADPDEALEILTGNSVDVVITDWSMPAGGGFRLLEELSARSPELPVLVISGYLPDNVKVNRVAAIEVEPSGKFFRTLCRI